VKTRKVDEKKEICAKFKPSRGTRPYRCFWEEMKEEILCRAGEARGEEPIGGGTTTQVGTPWIPMWSGLSLKRT